MIITIGYDKVMMTLGQAGKGVVSFAAVFFRCHATLALRDIQKTAKKEPEREKKRTRVKKHIKVTRNPPLLSEAFIKYKI